jgi:hypothetical protein
MPRLARAGSNRRASTRTLPAAPLFEIEEDIYPDLGFTEKSLVEAEANPLNDMVQQMLLSDPNLLKTVIETSVNSEISFKLREVVRDSITHLVADEDSALGMEIKKQITAAVMQNMQAILEPKIKEFIKKLKDGLEISVDMY